ncbi:short-chain fatty acyl-CoA regulator family protein [Yinghuangia sp. ASG 101]|uniref:short-chain fatty acyl-CoA regulator family protein n=1 Tax=Yinghuangia sp. ASG 101 TaxID=2896848 RepID=UPI001E504723|nr:short-chain fatty acyl-CoA regulator family protein [Yinghuangia sp. ASG 101]UGQ11707.1 short-chain fatty acyl-CoA regulator family protein [Yinghuangia sp. ASG 101]
MAGRGRPPGDRQMYAGPALRRLRRLHGLSQVDLARRLDMSPSYLNQMEHDRRPITVPVLLRITETLGVTPDFFADSDRLRLGADVRAALADEAAGGRRGGAADGDEIQELVRQFPDAARALVALHRRYREAADRAAVLAGHPDTLDLAEPHDEVRDFFAARRNHIAELDDAAEELAEAAGIAPGASEEALIARLGEHHGVRVVTAPHGRAGSVSEDPRRYDPGSATLHLAAHLTPGQRAFQQAVQLAALEFRDLIDAVVTAADLTGPDAPALARVGLAHYCAGALVMPYTAFHRDAEELRYDIDLLAARYGVGFETACHRLSTLQRRRAGGVPFAFLRVDRAGNISKRQSATDFHFSRFGGTCPLWTVYEAFTSPGRILTQIATMPDGRAYFWIARTVTRGQPGWGAPGATFAVALGCELRHAHRLVYADGLALDDPRAATPIGMGCRVCERHDCPQRANPAAGNRLAVDENRTTATPYRVRGAR